MASGQTNGAVPPAPAPTADDVRALGNAVEQKITNDAKAGGAMAFNFNPDATPEQKAAQAKAAIPEALKIQKPTSGAAIATDLNSGPGQYANIPLATPSKTSVNGSVPPTPNTTLTNGTAVVKAALTKGSEPYPKAGDGEWGRTGWEPRFGTGRTGADNENEQGSLLDHATWLEEKLDDKFFGDWYHNAGVIIFACLSTWIVTFLGGGLGWVIIVMAICSTYYRTSIRRVHRNIRDDLARESALTKLETDSESLEWINTFVAKFWPIYQPVLAATIINTVDQILSTATPAFLDSLRLSTFTLGTKPPRLEHVRTYPRTEDDIVMMDWKFSFTPNDTSDMTSQQKKDKVNPKVVLEVRVGKGLASKGLPVIVEDFSFSGEMKVKIKLQVLPPHVEKVDVCFIEPPQFDYVCKPVGGDFLGLDIGFLPGLNGFITEQVHANLGPMMYAPNVFTVNVAQMLGGAAIDTAVGVLAVTVHSAAGLKNPDNFAGTPDPYAVLAINGREELARTSTKKENANPQWHETKYIVLTSLNESLSIEVFDYNDIRKDKKLGEASFPLKPLEGDAEQENIQLPVMSNGKNRGQVTCDFRFFPVIVGKKNVDGTVDAVPEYNTGILRYTVHQAKDLDTSKSLIGTLSPYAVQILNGKQQKKTTVRKRTNLPIWEESCEMLVTDRKNCKLGVVLKDSRDLQDDPILGTYQIKLTDMLDMMAKGTEWFNLTGVKTGRVKLSAQWKPVAIKGVIGGTGGYIKPIGVMRIHLIKATELRNLETVGKSDPYVRILLSGIEKAKTVTFENDLSPAWDEILYVPIHSTREKITLEVMDSEKLGKDRTLGQVDFDVSKYVTEVEDVEGEYLEHSERNEETKGLTLGSAKLTKGFLTYTVAFYPATNIVDLEEEAAAEKAAAAEAAAPGSRPLTATSAVSTIDSAKVEAKKVAATGLSGKEAELLAAAEAENEVPVKKLSVPIKMSPDEIIANDAGLLIVDLIEANFAHTDCRLEILMDDSLFPAYSSSKAKTRMHKFDEVTDIFVRELQFSRITLRLNEKSKSDGKDDEEDVVAELKGETYSILRQALYKPYVLTLRGKDGGESKVTISLKYLPVKMKLDARESIENSGTLRVELVDGIDLPAADRNGKSDPYVVFELNGSKVFKSETQKKTLAPVWNQSFEVQVPSRVGADFKLRAMDWDLAGDDDPLGEGKIDLTTLEPRIRKELKVPLDGKSGSIRVRLVFNSAWVTKARHSTATFGGTFASVPGKVLTGAIGAPVKGVKGVGGGMMKGASFIGRGLRGKSKDEGTAEVEAPEVSVSGSTYADTNPAGSVRESMDQSVADSGYAQTAGSESPTRLKTPNRDSGQLSPYGTHRSNKSISGSSIAGIEMGVASITLVSASGFPAGSNLQVHIKALGKREKEVHKSKAHKNPDPTFDESFTHPCAADQQFSVVVRNDKTFGSGDKIGEGMLFVDDTGTGKEVSLPCGPGQVVFRSSFKHNETMGNSPRVRKSIFGVKRGGAPGEAS